MQTNVLANIIDRFAGSDCSWLSTVSPEGKAHSAPVWHAWLNGHVFVVTTGKAVKVRNIRSHPSVAITHPDPMDVIIVEGDASVVQGMKETLRPLFQAKYDWDIVTDEDYEVVIQIAPTKVIAWGKEGAGHRKRWSAQDLRGLGKSAS